MDFALVPDAECTGSDSPLVSSLICRNERRIVARQSSGARNLDVALG